MKLLRIAEVVRMPGGDEPLWSIVESVSPPVHILRHSCRNPSGKATACTMLATKDIAPRARDRVVESFVAISASIVEALPLCRFPVWPVSTSNAGTVMGFGRSLDRRDPQGGQWLFQGRPETQSRMGLAVR